MIKLYICCLVLIIGSVEVGLDIDMKFHQEVMEIVSYDNIADYYRARKKAVNLKFETGDKGITKSPRRLERKSHRKRLRFKRNQ